MRRRTLLNQGIKLDPVTGRGIIDGYEVVDLGLPSGTLWATCNIGATTETGYGNYYMYGKGASRYNSSDSSYNGTENPLSVALDTAYQVMGPTWHMPTKAQFEELVLNTDYIWIDNTGGKFTSKTDANKYIIFPAAGMYVSGSHYYSRAKAHYFTNTPYGSGKAYVLYVNTGSISVTGEAWRYYGCSVRGVHAAT